MDATGYLGKWHYTCASSCNVLVLYEAFWSKDGTRNTREKGFLFYDNPTVLNISVILEKQKVAPVIKLFTYLAQAMN